MIFFALFILWDSGKAAWEDRQMWSPLFQVMRDLGKELLVTDSIVYADDRSLMDLSEASAQEDTTYIHIAGPPLGLVLNLLKCVIRRVVAISSYTSGTAKRASLTRVLPPPPSRAG